MNENNVRTLSFVGDTPQVMPEDVFEGTVPPDLDYSEAVDQYAGIRAAERLEEDEGGTIVVGDFASAEEAEPLVKVELHQSQPFFYLEIPSLGLQAPLDVDVSLALFDALGAAINGL